VSFPEPGIDSGQILDDQDIFVFEMANNPTLRGFV
jgi:hypothetical protein